MICLFLLLYLDTHNRFTCRTFDVSDHKVSCRFTFVLFKLLNSYFSAISWLLFRYWMGAAFLLHVTAVLQTGKGYVGVQGVSENVDPLQFIDSRTQWFLSDILWSWVTLWRILGYIIMLLDIRWNKLTDSCLSGSTRCAVELCKFSHIEFSTPRFDK